MSAPEELSDQDLERVKASLPLVRLHALAFAGRIIERLSADPDLAALLAGTEQVREGLARIILGCAADPAMTRGQLMAALDSVPAAVRAGVHPGHAPQVAHAFRHAMQDVFMMGDADPVLASWLKAYGRLAKMAEALSPSPP